MCSVSPFRVLNPRSYWSLVFLTKAKHSSKYLNELEYVKSDFTYQLFVTDFAPRNLPLTEGLRAVFATVCLLRLCVRLLDNVMCPPEILPAAQKIADEFPWQFWLHHVVVLIQFMNDPTYSFFTYAYYLHIFTMCNFWSLNVANTCRRRTRWSWWLLLVNKHMST